MGEMAIGANCSLWFDFAVMASGYLDAIAVNQVGEFEQGLLRLVRDSHGDLLEALRTKKEVTDEIGAQLKSVVDDYAKAFAA